ncbi:MAG: class I SAM-dependent methyltransferase [Desulfobacterales bacterium]|nr:class I SAM-dependent methyltransferase [Desulfobacterales bacterium]
MDSRRKQTFNSVYSGRGCYYGLDVRPEFSEYFQNKDLSGQTAIDLGCGEGRYALYLAKKGCRVLGVDRSRTGVEKLEKMAEAQNLPIIAQTADIAEVDPAPASTDIIVAATILDHLEGELRRRAINGIKSALKPGGILYANVFTVSDPGYKLKKRGGNDQVLFDVSETAAGIAHYFAKEELKAVFKDFSVITYHETVEPDHSHGRPHFHGWACLLAQKPGA